MRHVLLKSHEDRVKLMNFYLEWKDSRRSLWKEEDLPKLQEFFRYSDLPPEKRRELPFPKESFEFYKKCDEEYANANAELRDSLRYVEEHVLIRAFGFEQRYSDNEDSDEMVIVDEMEPLNYPVIAVVWFDSSWDRGGNSSVACVDYVEKKEFDECPGI